MRLCFLPNLKIFNTSTRITLGIASCLLLAAPLAKAANVVDIWDDAHALPILNQFYFDNQLSKNNKQSANAYFYTGVNKATNNPLAFKAINAVNIGNASHVRYAQYYQGLPIWGSQIVVHHKSHTKMTGSVVLGVEKDIVSTTPNLTKDAVLQLVKADFNHRYSGHQLSSWRQIRTKEVIFINKKSEEVTVGQAKLAYYLSFFVTDATTHRLLQPTYLIDAGHGLILQYYDNVKTDGVGSGPGGNDITLSYAATNHYQFGTTIAGVPSFSLMPVTVDSTNNICTMITPEVRLSSYNNVPGSMSDFPITFAQEVNYPVFSYSCSSSTGYQNSNDGGYAPIINHGYAAYSPSNDTFYFAQMTYVMMQKFIPSILNPWGTLLPIRIYTHVGDFHNAFAISANDDVFETINAQPETTFNSQFIVGNGQTEFYPLSDSGTVAHELSHIFTNFQSNLIYADQSGGINEAYSDIAGQTLQYYLSQLYPWYAYSWEISASIVLPSGPIGGKALRYMNYPPLDGESIANAANYVPGMDVHFSSGVYNYAFYIMVAKNGVNFYNAYIYFSHANAAYWQPSSDFNHASCGVMQAALDAGNRPDFNSIVQAFKDVGVKCTVGIKQLSTPL